MDSPPQRSTRLFLLQGKILGVESPYGAVCRSFNKLAFQDEDSEHSLSLQERDMIEVGCPPSIIISSIALSL